MATNINGVTTTVAANPSNNAGQAAIPTQPEQQQSQFLTLLVAQMRNQDPLNPMDNYQMTSQFAQLNMVSGINQLNKTLSSLVSNQQVGDSLKAANLIGHEVMVATNKVQLAGGVGQMGMDLSQDADNVKINIQDGSGNIIRTLDLGQQAAGIQKFVWDGSTDNGLSAIEGNYSFDIKASNNNTPVSATALATGNVGNVSMSGGVVKANVSPWGQIALSDIREIL